MSIYKINSSLPTTTKIELLNDMVIELNGKIAQGKFDKNELAAVYADLGSGYVRKFLRDQSLGHTLATYTGWTHVHAESGYSIWKYAPTKYAYNTLNELYFDGALVENRGQANSEAALTFDKVFLYNGDSGTGYIDDTTEAGTEDGVAFELNDSIEDYLYVGQSTTFAGISFEFQDRGSGYTLEFEYWNGSAWVDLNRSGYTFVDDTSNFESDGRVYFDIPTNWAQTLINAQTKYWVRIKTTTAPTTSAMAYLVYPANSVISMLQLSSAEILNEEWAWCTYGTTVYVTIRNTGTSAYEGDYFVSTSSSAVNKQNFFISNHEYSASYQSTDWS